MAGLNTRCGQEFELLAIQPFETDSSIFSMAINSL